MEGDLIKNQRVDEGRIEAEHGKLDYKDSSEDEEVKLSLIRQGRISVMCRRHRTLSGTNGCLGWSLSRGLGRSGIRGGGATPSGTRMDGGLGHRRRWGCSLPEHGTSRRSDPSFATGSVEHARGGRGNDTEEGCSRTWGPSGS